MPNVGDDATTINISIFHDIDVCMYVYNVNWWPSPEIACSYALYPNDLWCSFWWFSTIQFNLLILRFYRFAENEWNKINKIENLFVLYRIKTTFYWLYVFTSKLSWTLYRIENNLFQFIIWGIIHVPIFYPFLFDEKLLQMVSP